MYCASTLATSNREKWQAEKITQNLLLGIAILMAIPILVGFLSLTLNDPLNRWTNIVATIIFLGFNLLGLPTYHSAYHRFLIIAGLGFNTLTIWYACQWQGEPLAKCPSI